MSLVPQQDNACCHKICSETARGKWQRASGMHLAWKCPASKIWWSCRERAWKKKKRYLQDLLEHCALAIINVLNKYVMMVVSLPVSRFVFSPPQFIFSKDSNLGEQCFLARFFTFRGSTRNSLNIGYEQFQSKNKKALGSQLIFGELLLCGWVGGQSGQRNVSKPGEKTDRQREGHCGLSIHLRCTWKSSTMTAHSSATGVPLSLVEQDQKPSLSIKQLSSHP